MFSRYTKDIIRFRIIIIKKTVKIKMYQNQYPINNSGMNQFATGSSKVVTKIDADGFSHK